MGIKVERKEKRNRRKQIGSIVSILMILIIGTYGTVYIYENFIYKGSIDNIALQSVYIVSDEVISAIELPSKGGLKVKNLTDTVTEVILGDKNTKLEVTQSLLTEKLSTTITIKGNTLVYSDANGFSMTVNGDKQDLKIVSDIFKKFPPKIVTIIAEDMGEYKYLENNLDYSIEDITSNGLSRTKTGTLDSLIRESIIKLSYKTDKDIYLSKKDGTAMITDKYNYCYLIKQGNTNNKFDIVMYQVID